MISTSLLFTTGRWLHLFMTKRHQWHNWRVVRTPSGMYLCQRTIFWTYNANVYVFAIRQKISLNSRPILKIRPNACRHLKNLCKLGLRPEFGPSTKSDLFHQVTGVFQYEIIGIFLYFQIPIFEPRSDGRHNFVNALIFAANYNIPEVTYYLGWIVNLIIYLFDSWSLTTTFKLS